MLSSCKAFTNMVQIYFMKNGFVSVVISFSDIDIPIYFEERTDQRLFLQEVFLLGKAPFCPLYWLCAPLVGLYFK